jgi:hypothetical protein
MATKKTVSFKKPPKGSTMKVKKLSVKKLLASKVKIPKIAKVSFRVAKVPNRFGRKS